MSDSHASRMTVVAAFVIVAITVVGYFTGLQAPMSPATSGGPASVDLDSVDDINIDGERVIPATHYANMPAVAHKRSQIRQTQLTELKSLTDPLAEVSIQPGEKSTALRIRSANRAFNGAPPTVPHPLEQLSDQSCVACHTNGARTASLRIPQMSHQMLKNCTQCHVEQRSQHLEPVVFRGNLFTGLTAPNQGARAFRTAPPVIPHSTWMRSNCMSCHGLVGLQGIRTTHPWRQNCQQCHVPSAELNQFHLAADSDFLPGPPIINE